MSSKKLKTKNIRHILESPFQIKWSEKDDEEIVPIQNLLIKHLPAAKLEKVPINLQFKGKKVIKERTTDNIKTRQQNEYRTYLAPGFQSVVQGLEKGELCCVVVSSDIAPSMLLKVLLVQAQVNGVPLLVIPNLKTLTKSALGFSAMALGFKNIVAESPEKKFYEIFQMISQNPTLITAPAYPIKTEFTEPMGQSTEDLEKESVNLSQPIKTKNLYLYRSDFGTRAFVPESNRKDDDLKSEMDENFIFIGKVSEPERKPAIVKKNVMQRMSDDEDDSDDEVSFFVDAKADNTLLERLQPKLDVEVNKGSKLGHSSSTKGEPFQMTNKNANKKKKNKTKIGHLSNLSKVNFKPLQMKTITANPNRSKGKKKNKMK